MKLVGLFLALACLAGQLPAADKGVVERHTVRGRALEANLAGDSPDRLVSVYLPPGYAKDPDRRYPVLYMLHGFTDSESKWMGHEEHWIHLPEVIDRSLAAGASEEMIVVMPDAHTRFFGSFYSRSATTGDWETYIADELVAYVDSHYRTLADRMSRGLAGHSMGGYGAMRIGMKRPDVFSSIYLLSPCCLAPRTSGGPQRESGETPNLEVSSFEELAKAGFRVKAAYATAAAWAPNPSNPPFFLDLAVKDGEVRPEILAKAAANAPIAMLDQYILEIKMLEGLGMDAGDEDRSIAAAVRQLDLELEKYGVEREFEIYSGDHINRVAERIETKMLPFFSRTLRFER